MKPNKKEQIIVEGMTCTNCAASVTKRLEKLGLTEVSTDYISGEVQFENISKINNDTISNEIKKLGYRLKPKSETSKTSLSPISFKFYFSLFFTLPLLAHMLLPHEHVLNNAWLQFALCLPVFLIGVWHFGRSAFYSVLGGSANMDVLIFIGSTAAFIYSVYGTLLYYPNHEVHAFMFYETTATIITLVFLGNLIEHNAVNQTTDSIKKLKQLQQSKARKINTIDQIETITEISFDQIQINDILQINKGERIPSDAEIISGSALLDESLLTGESIPVSKSVGQNVIGGTILLEGNIRIKVNKNSEDTVLSHIIDLVKNAHLNKPNIQKLGDRVSAIFVPIVLLLSLLTFIISYFIVHLETGESIMRAIAVLVISCPCAMGLATPTAVVAGIGRAAKNGILIKGGSTLEQLASIRRIAFDKTGTLTSGNFTIHQIELFNEANPENINNIIYSLEQKSNHPIAKSICKQLKDQSVTVEIQKFKETIGEGLSGYDLDSNFWQLGSYRLVNDQTFQKENSIFLLKNNQLMAIISISDELKPGSKKIYSSLQKLGIEMILVSGDKFENTQKVANLLGIQKFYAEQTPIEKLLLIEQLNKEMKTAMIGDGVNDSPALSKAHLGFSFGNASDIAINSAQIILLQDDLSKIDESIRIGKHTLITIKQNLFWAFFYNIIAIPIAALGFLNPMVAAAAMAFSDVFVIGNSIRLKYKSIK